MDHLIKAQKGILSLSIPNVKLKIALITNNLS